MEHSGMKHFITSLQHPFVKHLVKLRQDSDYRYEQQALVIEGIKPIKEVPSSLIRKLVYVDERPLGVSSAPEEWIVSENIMKKVSGMSSPEGLLAEIQMPSFSSLEGFHLIVALDGVNDPGNMGTLLRTALAFGWQGVFLLPNCCDPFNEKVIRAARGAHFKLPLAKGSVEQFQHLIQKNQLNAFVADLQGQAPERAIESKRRVLVLGNEAHGASAAVKSLCSPITIPMPGEMESLNVAIAGGILMYLLRD
jgi:RNA methyltransferase, TrmH family